MPKQSSKETKGGSSRKLDTTIIVALIALVGTLATALFSSPVIIAWIQRTPAPPAQTNPPSSSSVDSSGTVETSLTPLSSVVTSSDESCLKQYFADIDSAKLGSIEVGADKYVYLSSDEFASKEFLGPFGIKLTQNGKMIGAFTIIFFPDTKLFKLTSIVDSNCQPILGYSNTSNSGDPNAIRNFSHLLFQLAEARFDMEFQFNTNDRFELIFKQLR
ncbi:MAG: hypothetical protein NTW69_16855 [Chloroflexi bacterium]|nr:hypothetical protein [Chloroflexota bacterium]